MSTIKTTTLHPDNDPNIDLYPRTLATLVEGLDAAITTKAPRPVACKIVLPKGATKGNLTEEQLTILSASPSNYIEMVNDKELYYLNDPGHESGFYTYSHVGIENSKATIKTLTITISAKSFVIVTTVVPTDAGGNLCLHRINFGFTINSDNAQMFINVYNTNKVELTFDSLVGVNYGYIPVIYIKSAPPKAGSLSIPGNTTILDFYTADNSQAQITPDTINGFSDIVTDL